MSFSQLLCGNDNVNQSSYGDINDRLKDVTYVKIASSSNIATITTPPINSHNASFRDETSLPPFTNCQNQTIENDENLHVVAKNFDHSDNPSSFTNTDLLVPIESYKSTFEEDEINLRFQPANLQHSNDGLLKEPFDSSKLQIRHSNSQISSTPPPFISRESQRQSYHHQNQLVSVGNSTKAKRKTLSKKTKNQTVKVVQMPFHGNITSRCWRKYGQKPIKGSPHPRAYYRCRLHEGCLAKKRVDRKISDPNFIIVTYAGNHNHPLPLGLDDCTNRVNNTIKSDEGDDNNNILLKSKVCVHVSSATNKQVEGRISKDKTYDVNNDFDEIKDDAIFEGLDVIVDLPDDGLDNFIGGSVVQNVVG